jgi:hypothetical protein
VLTIPLNLPIWVVIFRRSVVEEANKKIGWADRWLRLPVAQTCSRRPESNLIIGLYAKNIDRAVDNFSDKLTMSDSHAAACFFGNVDKIGIPAATNGRSNDPLEILENTKNTFVFKRFHR